MQLVEGWSGVVGGGWSGVVGGGWSDAVGGGSLISGFPFTILYFSAQCMLCHYT